jgi:hypothetical protein
VRASEDRKHYMAVQVDRSGDAEHSGEVEHIDAFVHVPSLSADVRNFTTSEKSRYIGLPSKMFVT